MKILRLLQPYALVFFFTLCVYFASGWRNHTDQHYFIPLADAFLQGRVYLDRMHEGLKELVSEEEVRTGAYARIDQAGTPGKYFVILPPFPAVILMPFVAIFGASTNQSYVSTIVTALGVVAAYAVFRHLLPERKKHLALTALYAFGSMTWYHGVIGSGWYFSQMCGLLFLWVALLLLVKKKSLLLVSACVGVAYLSRYPLLLTFPFFSYMTRERWCPEKRIAVRELLTLLIPFASIVTLSLFYNLLRYQTPAHYGYTVYEDRPYNTALEYPYGSYSVMYAPRILSVMLFSMPKLNVHFPYIIPNDYAMALWLVFPAVFIIFFASIQHDIVFASWVTILLLLPVTLFHGGVGMTQFGFRYALDYMPFLFILIGYAIRDKFLTWQRVLFVLSVVINIWGILYTGL